ncbi:hypothetical protein BCEP4_480068 [Burkholderia cepacia]|nr:hypothetical protein BCEP4_480068 [Burkholderia cepacia]
MSSSFIRFPCLSKWNGCLETLFQMGNVEQSDEYDSGLLISITCSVLPFALTARARVRWSGDVYKE